MAVVAFHLGFDLGEKLRAAEEQVSIVLAVLPFGVMSVSTPGLGRCCSL